MRELVVDLVTMYSHMADHGVEVSAVVANDVPDMVLLDPLRVRQVLANGITNALKLTRTGAVRVQVNASVGWRHSAWGLQ